MELLDKLTILADAAKYDAACTSSGVRRGSRPGMIGNTSSSLAGCCHSFSADGRCITLLKVLMTNYCVYDCKYCVNRCSNDVPRTAFTPEELAELTIDGGDTTVAEALREKILTIGEKLTIRRFTRFEGNVVSYIHGGGNIGVLVNLDTELANDVCVPMAKDVAMQIAAMNPQFLDKDSVPSDFIEKEKEILLAQAINEGKPANIAEKMVLGRINKYYKEICLLEQPFVKNDDITVGAFVADTAKALGGSICVKEFARLEKGEGLQKREDDFAAEVAGMVK